jgi:RNA polymerase sigma-70 factor (ECF subfamily)
VRRLTARDPATLAHFCAYFQKVLTLTLRGRGIDSALADDVRQETFARVLKILWEGPGVKQPEKFGAMVVAVCKNVLREPRFRPATGASEELSDELPDRATDRLTSLITEEDKRRVAAVLDELSAKDREILRLIFYEQADRLSICARMQVKPDNLRTLLHRALNRFRQAYVRKYGLAAHILLLWCHALGLCVTT